MKLVDEDMADFGYNDKDEQLGEEVRTNRGNPNLIQGRELGEN